MREQSRNAAVAVQEGVDPRQAMVGCGDADDFTQPRKVGRRIAFGEPIDERRQIDRVRRDMSANADVLGSQHARSHGDFAAGLWIFDHQHFCRQTFAEVAMCPGDKRFGHNWAGPVPAVDHPLHFNVRARLELEVAPLRLCCELVVHGAVDIDRQRVVSLNQIGVVTVH